MTAITQSQAGHHGAAAPRVWLLFGERRGDNAQVRALADMLGWPAEVKQLRWLPDEIEPANAGISLAGLDANASDPLTAPWRRHHRHRLPLCADRALDRRANRHRRDQHPPRPAADRSGRRTILSSPRHNTVSHRHRMCASCYCRWSASTPRETAKGRCPLAKGCWRRFPSRGSPSCWAAQRSTWRSTAAVAHRLADELQRLFRACRLFAPHHHQPAFTARA